MGRRPWRGVLIATAVLLSSVPAARSEDDFLEEAGLLGPEDAFWLGAPLPEGELETPVPRGRLSLGIRGSMSREGEERGVEWGPTVTYELGSTDEAAANRLKYELEYSFNDALTRFVGEESAQNMRVRVHELRYAKLTLLKVMGFDVPARIGMSPYVAGGIQYVDSRGDLGAEGRVQDFFWAPTIGGGLELDVRPRTVVSIDFERNFEPGRRRISRFSFELKLRVFGAEE